MLAKLSRLGAKVTAFPPEILETNPEGLDPERTPTLLDFFNATGDQQKTDTLKRSLGSSRRKKRDTRPCMDVYGATAVPVAEFQPWDPRPPDRNGKTQLVY